jgi:hypothetical protein
VDLFTNDAIDLGTANKLARGGIAALNISLTETTTEADAGFYGDFLVGVVRP